MISVHSMKRPMIGGQPYAFEFKGLSTDTKPSVWGGNDVGVNSLFFEQDTGDFYYLKQQGSESQGDLLYEDTLSDWTFYDWANASIHNSDLTESQILDILATSTIKVIWNGVPYICQSRPYGDRDVEFGATYGDGGYDFSDYPFYINTYAEDFVLTFATSMVGDVNVEIYQYSSVDTIWEKIGGGEGGEMKNPKVVVTVVNPTDKDIAVAEVETYELKNGMLISNVRHMIKAGESEVIEYYVVGHTNYNNFYDGTGETVSYSAPDPYGMDALNTQYYGEPSNLVNIDENNYNIIDPTKPASFTATLTVD